MEEFIWKLLSQGLIPAGIAVYTLMEVKKTLQGLRDSLDLNTNVLLIVLDKIGCGDEVKTLLLQKRTDAKEQGNDQKAA